MLEINRTTQGHRLLIKLVSNNDPLTSKGFELKLKGIKKTMYILQNKEQISHITFHLNKRILRLLTMAS